MENTECNKLQNMVFHDNYLTLEIILERKMLNLFRIVCQKFNVFVKIMALSVCALICSTF